MRPIRVLVVDDSAFMRAMITRVLSAAPGIHVLDTAVNGSDGVRKAQDLRPDLITMDVEMPVMNGIDAVRALRLLKLDPRPIVLMCSTLTSEGSETALEALRLGADDIIAKDSNKVGQNRSSFGSELAAKVLALGDAALERLRDAAGPHAAGSAPYTPTTPHTLPPLDTFKLVAVGSSTGGPPVLERLVSSLPPDLTCPVVIAQHMPGIFTASMARRFASMCRVPVHHATGDMPIAPGQVFIVEGARHGRVHKNGSGFRLEISDEPLTAPYKPSVNELMRSAGEAAGPGVLGVMCTGMGDDGRRGTEVLKERGGTMVAQDKASCVVYGMPKAVIEHNLADAVMPPDGMARLLAGLSRAALRRAA
jgi:two-component system chemotaxis response regulator CheB